MSILEDKKLLIGILLFLVGIKFLLMPLFDWQDAKIEQIQRYNKQLNKGNFLVKNQQTMLETVNEIKQRSASLLNKVASKADTRVSYQLKVQKEVELLMEKYELRARSVTWLKSIKSGPFDEHRLELSLAGSFKNYIRFLNEIESVSPKLNIIELRANVSKMFPKRNELGSFSGKVIVSGLNANMEANSE